MKQDRRGSWYLLTGVVLGIVLGLIYAWVVSPVQFVDAPPSALRADYKNEYRALIAEAYLYSNDLLRAKERLTQLKDDDMLKGITMQAQQALANGRPEEEVHALSMLAMALSQDITPTISSSVRMPGTTPLPSSPAGGTVASTPLPEGSDGSSSLYTQAISQSIPATQTDTPTTTIDTTLIVTPTATPGDQYTLQETSLVCNHDQAEPYLQVNVKDTTGQPIPGVELVVNWADGEDHFYTGLKPELGLGYGDFVMTPRVVYSTHVNNGGQVVNDLTAAECVANDGSKYWGSWFLTFIKTK